jgi:hypothetical protein
MQCQRHRIGGSAAASSGGYIRFLSSRRATECQPHASKQGDAAAYGGYCEEKLDIKRHVFLIGVYKHYLSSREHFWRNGAGNWHSALFGLEERVRLLLHRYGVTPFLLRSSNSLLSHGGSYTKSHRPCH